MSSLFVDSSFLASANGDEYIKFDGIITMEHFWKVGIGINNIPAQPLIYRGTRSANKFISFCTVLLQRPVRQTVSNTRRCGYGKWFGNTIREQIAVQAQSEAGKIIWKILINNYNGTRGACVLYTPVDYKTFYNIL